MADDEDLELKDIAPMIAKVNPPTVA